jgi:NADH:ubiquinone oxidoreductase subunit F (NADH-binding)
MRLLPEKPVTTLDEYRSLGGLQGVAEAQRIGPEATVDLITRSGLRGRGGAGFPTGRKWTTIRTSDDAVRYVAVNCAEGEPGTFKDRALMRANPYQLVEGVIIAAFAVGAAEVFIAIKAGFTRERENVVRAVEELQRAGVCTDCTVTIADGPEDYLFGEEKAMLEVIEGKAAMPRILPPYEHGLFATAPQVGWEAEPVDPIRPAPGASNPTLVNNCETLSNVPWIMARGADWFRSMGTDESPGTVVCTMVGDVVWPDVAEIEMGLPLQEAIQVVGSGVGERRSVKAVFSGVSNPVVTAGDLGVPLSYEGFRAIGSGLGAAGFIVYDDTACMVEVARQFSRFLSIESCGQCPPCKLGSTAITERLRSIEAGAGTDADVAEIGGWLERVTDGNRCFLAVEERQIVSSVLRNFPDEVAQHIERGGCPRPRPLPFPKLTDIEGGQATYANVDYLNTDDR